MAIEEQPERIAFYGVDMAATTEYLDQRLGCQFFAREAAKLGIEVGVPPESDLLRPAPLYGVCEQSHAWIKQRTRAVELNGRLKQQQEAYTEASNQIHFLQGAIDDQDWQLHSWFGAHDFLSNSGLSPYISTPVPPKKPEFAASTIKAPPKKRGRPRKK